MKQLGKGAKDAWNSLQKVREEVSQDVSILVVADNQSNAEQFIAGLAPNTNEKSIFSVMTLEDDKLAQGLIKPALAADLVLVVLEEEILFAKKTILAITSVYQLDRPFLLVIGKKAASESQILKEKAERVYNILPSQIVTTALDRIDSSYELTYKLLNQCGSKALALGRALGVVRPAVVKQITDKTKWQNALIGAVTIFPGSDLPLLTLNQARMVLMIAAVYGAELSLQRARELLVVLGGGFTFRAAARELLTLMAFPGWIIKGSIAYLGTEVIAKAAERYFASGLDQLTGEDIKQLLSKNQ